MISLKYLLALLSLAISFSSCKSDDSTDCEGCFCVYYQISPQFVVYDSIDRPLSYFPDSTDKASLFSVLNGDTTHYEAVPFQRDAVRDGLLSYLRISHNAIKLGEEDAFDRVNDIFYLTISLKEPKIEASVSFEYDYFNGPVRNCCLCSSLDLHSIRGSNGVLLEYDNEGSAILRLP